MGNLQRKPNKFPQPRRPVDLNPEIFSLGTTDTGDNLTEQVNNSKAMIRCCATIQRFRLTKGRWQNTM